MAFSAVGTIGSSTSATPTVVPAAVGDFLLLGALAGFPAGSAASGVTALTSSGISWLMLAGPTTFASSIGVETLFIGYVSTAGSQVVTPTFSGATPALRFGWQEFISSTSYSIDTSGITDTATTGTSPAITPNYGAGELYFEFLWSNGTASAGSTPGYVYQLDANGNPLVYNVNCTNAVQQPNIGGTSGTSGIGVLLHGTTTGGGGNVPNISSVTLTGGEPGQTWTKVSDDGLSKAVFTSVAT